MYVAQKYQIRQAEDGPVISIWVETGLLGKSAPRGSVPFRIYSAAGTAQTEKYDSRQQPWRHPPTGELQRSIIRRNGQMLASLCSTKATVGQLIGIRGLAILTSRPCCRFHVSRGRIACWRSWHRELARCGWTLLAYRRFEIGCF